jgi:hypothetical protein
MLACGGESVESEEDSTESLESTTIEEVVAEEEIINKILIETNVVGIFVIGEPVPKNLPNELKMRQFYEEDLDDEGNAIEHTHNVVFNALEDVVELIMDREHDGHHEDKNIHEMFVLSDYYLTNRDIGVGSSVEEFKETFSDVTVWYDKIHDRYYLETLEIERTQFIFDMDDIVKKAKGSRDFQEINFSYIAEGAKIDRIRLL